MSINTKLAVFNASNQSMQVTCIVSHNSDWGNDKPSNNFNNVTINAFSSRVQEEDLDSDANSANFQLTCTYANGDVVTITTNQRFALSNVADNVNLGGPAANNYRSFIMGDGSDLLIAMIPNVASATWMKDTWDSIKDKQLCQIAMPGSHDAGMYKLNYSTDLSTNDNTRTQSVKIGDQLTEGSRFFELRPMIWKSETGSSDMYLGHFSDIFVVGTEGSLGEKLENVLKDVKTFITNPANDHEIVVLRFEQYHDIDNDFSDFSDTQKGNLKKLVLDILGDYLYTNQDYNCNVGYVNVQDMVNTNKRVIAAFNGFTNRQDKNGVTLLDPSSGVFSYGECTSSSPHNYRLMDLYANSDEFSTMMNDQFNKFNSFNATTYPGGMFLLSWTLTMQVASDDYVDNSIQNLAKTANSYLWYGIFKLFKEGRVQTNKIPNIIYVDFVDSNYCLAEAAYCLNSFATGY